MSERRITVADIERLMSSVTPDPVAALADGALYWIEQRDELADELADVLLAMDDVDLEADSVVGMVRELVAKYQALRK